jgi:glycosyltransferase involved in cell wall biosynthesis
MATMIKVLMLCDYPRDSSEVFGGTSRAAHNLIQALVNYTDTDVATFSLWPGGKSAQFFSDSDGRIRVYRFPATLRFRGIIGYADKKYILRKVMKKENPDIVHAQGDFYYATLAVGSGLPNVFTIHGVGLREIEIKRAELGPLKYFMRKRLVRSNYRKASNIVAINEYTKNQVAHLHNARVWVIRNAADERFFDMRGRETPEVGNILLVGGVRRRKDVVTAVKAVRDALEEGVDVRLHIVGPVESEYKSEVDELIERYGLSNNVIIHGLVTGDHLRDLYLKCDVFLLTSREESSPISIVEAMAAGKPVVSTDVGGVPEIVNDGENALLAGIGDHKKIAQLIARIVRDRDLREEFGKASSEIAMADWSSRTVAIETERMYKEILNGR